MTTTSSLQQIALDFIDARTESSFTALYKRLKPGLTKFVMKYHQDSDVVDEILAITLSKAYVFVDKYDSQWNFSTWIYKICQNECLMEIRRQNSNISFESISDANMPMKAVRDSDWKYDMDYEFYDHCECIETDSLYSDVLEEIKNLPDHYKEIITDRVVNKMKYKDIAEKRGLKINTVRSRIHSAKKVIKKKWVDAKLKEGTTTNINMVGVTVLDTINPEKKKKKEKKVLQEVVRDDNDKSLSLIEFKSAIYGSEEKNVNIIEQVKDFFYKYDKIVVSNKLANGDPCKGQKKKLYLEYEIDGIPYFAKINEGTHYDFIVKCNLKK
jgi:RNA polymerase sigma-70 factor (ECF subfamily)